MPLRPGQLSRQRAIASRDLTSRCEIHRYTETQNSLGESIKSWQPIATGVPCRLMATGAVTGRERIRLEAIGQVTSWRLIFAWNQDVTNRDRVYVTDPLPLRGFDISQVLAPHTDHIRTVAMVEESS